MVRKELPIVVFDSGLGGLSVLRALRRTLPEEHFVYFGDSANAPYGSRPTEEVRDLTVQALEALDREFGCKAIVVACNTATSAAITDLRARFSDRPVIGIEPALKPAVDRHPGGQVVVMATETTLREQKFARLMQTYAARAGIVPLPCPGLMDFVERGELDSPALRQLLKSLLSDYPAPDAVVLGCTHYPFLRPVLQSLLPTQTEILDGSEGTAAHTRRRLEEAGLLREADGTEPRGSLLLKNSSPDPEKRKLAELLLSLPSDVPAEDGSPK